MDFTLPKEIDATRLRIRAFVEEKLIPLEGKTESFDAHENISPALLKGLRAEAQRQGLWRSPCRRRGAGKASPWSAWPPATRR